MPYKDPDPTDPNMLVGVVVPGDIESQLEMAYVFAEEFARMGYDGSQIMSLFETPYYHGAHGAYQALGDAKIRSIVDECVGVWGIKVVTRDRDACSPRARTTNTNTSKER